MPFVSGNRVRAFRLLLTIGLSNYNRKVEKDELVQLLKVLNMTFEGGKKFSLWCLHIPISSLQFKLIV